MKVTESYLPTINKYPYSIGDKVRIVKDSNIDDPFKDVGLKIGDVWTVLNIYTGSYPIAVKFDILGLSYEDGLGCNPDEIELVDNYTVELL